MKVAILYIDTNLCQHLQWSAAGSFPRDGQRLQTSTSRPCNTHKVNTAPVRTPTGGNEMQSSMSAPEPTKKGALTLLHVDPAK